MPSDPKYSFKDFTGHDLSDRKDMDNLTIEGSCFSHETPDAAVLPTSLKNTTFIDCNLDNVLIPAGATVIRGSTQRFQVQADGEDWVIDGKGTPIEPVNKEAFDMLGLSTDPADIAPTDSGKCVTIQKILDISAAKETAIQNAIDQVDNAVLAKTDLSSVVNSIKIN